MLRFLLSYVYQNFSSCFSLGVFLKLFVHSAVLFVSFHLIAVFIFVISLVVMIVFVAAVADVKGELTSSLDVTVVFL